MPRSDAGTDVDVRDLTWRPARRRTPVLTDLDLRIPAGQRVLVTGPSGAGKSTLLRALAGVLLSASHGDLSGEVRLGGVPVGTSSGQVGLLMQNPLAGVVAETVGRDVAFGLENSGIPRDEMWLRVRSALAEAAFPYPEDHPTWALSGGETQRLALAGSLVLDCGLLLLDEPTSMLDPVAAQAVRDAVRRHVEARGITTVIVEHQIEPWLDFADRLIVLGSHGRIVADGPPLSVLGAEGESLVAQGVWVPGAPTPEPDSIDETLVEPWHCSPTEIVTATEVGVHLRSSLTRHRTPNAVALERVDAKLLSGRALAVTGTSGAGKSTLVSVLAGLMRPTRGRVTSSPLLATRRSDEPWRWRSPELVERLAWVPQQTEQGIVANTVLDEVLASSRSCGRDPTRARRRGEGLLETLGLSHLSNASPYHLSGGEQRRLMVAAALAHGPFGVLLDEPTVGQDRLTWSAVVGSVAGARDAGSGVALASHDHRVVDALADTVLHLQDGRVVVA